MNGIEKQAAFTRGYLPGDRSLAPLTVLVSTTVALWLILYLICVAGGALQYAASVDPQKVVSGLPGARRAASIADGSPVNMETTE
jgi:hypothetical protein